MIAWRHGFPGVVGWTYEAAYHCDACTFRRFGARALRDGVEDNEGNAVRPVFDWDEVGRDGAYCDDCGDCIVSAIGR